MAGQKAVGTTFAFQKEGGQAIVVGNLTNIGEVGADSDELDVTTLDSDGGYREFLQGFKDGGEVAMSGYYLEGKNQDEAIKLFDSGDKVTGVITFPSKSTMTFPCFVKSYKVGPAEVQGAVGFSFSVRVAGKPVFAAATTTSGA